MEYIWNRPQTDVYVSLVGRRRKLVASLRHSDFLRIKEGIVTEELQQFLSAIGEDWNGITVEEERMELAKKVLRIGGEYNSKDSVLYYFFLSLRKNLFNLSLD